jgi:hypothetical protein
VRHAPSRATFGTTSSGSAGSGTVVVDGRRDALVLQRQQREHRLDRAGRRQRVADHRLVGRDRQALGMRSPNTAETPRHSILSFSGVPVPCGVDVVDVVRREPGIGEALRMQPMIGLPSGLERVRWKRRPFSPQPRTMPRMRGAAGLAPFEALQHQRARALAMTKPSRFLEKGGEALGGSLGSTAPRAARSGSALRA